MEKNAPSGQQLFSKILKIAALLHPYLATFSGPPLPLGKGNFPLTTITNKSPVAFSKKSFIIAKALTNKRRLS
jgi:hypothetical protein